MRFEKLLWLALTFVLSSAAWEETSLVGGVTVTSRYEAADGGSKIPPP